MAHYAIIDKSNNMVVEVITGVDETVTQIDTDGTPVGGSSEAWEEYYASIYNDTLYYCKRTSYNGTIRGMFASQTCLYDPETDRFVSPLIP